MSLLPDFDGADAPETDHELQSSVSTTESESRVSELEGKEIYFV